MKVSLRKSQNQTEDPREVRLHRLVGLAGLGGVRDVGSVFPSCTQKFLVLDA